MQGFREIFETYGGDYEGTLGRFMGNEKMYMKFLGMFFKDENLHKLGYALSQGDMTAAFEAAHTLKGVTANMGLAPLVEAVCAIVEPLRKGEPREDYEAMYEVICEEFRKAEILREDLLNLEGTDN